MGDQRAGKRTVRCLVVSGRRGTLAHNPAAGRPFEEGRRNRERDYGTKHARLGGSGRDYLILGCFDAGAVDANAK